MKLITLSVVFTVLTTSNAFAEQTVLNNYYRRIPYYTSLIDLGGLDSYRISWLYIKRGFAYIAVNETEKGLSDLKAATEIDKSNADAYMNYGRELMLTNDFSNALSQLNIALNIDPVHQSSFNGKALINYLQEDYALAEENFRKSFLSDSSYAHDLLSLFLSLEKQNKSGKEELEGFAEDINNDLWPSQIIQMYLGNISAREFAKNMKSYSPPYQVEGYYYLAQYYLVVKKKRRTAIKYFKKAIKLEDDHHYEFWMSKQMLEKLGEI